MLLALGFSLDVYVFTFIHVVFLLSFFNCVHWVLKNGFLVVITLSVNPTEIILSTSRLHACNCLKTFLVFNFIKPIVILCKCTLQIFKLQISLPYSWISIWPLVNITFSFKSEVITVIERDLNFNSL